MMMYKRLGAVFLILALLAATMPIALASAAGISKGTASIGGSTAHVLTIRTGGNLTGEMTIGTGKFYTADTVAHHLARKNGEGGRTVAAAVNGGYFDAYSPGLRTYAAIVMYGALVNGGGTDKPTLGFTSDGRAIIDRVDLLPHLKLRGTIDINPWSVNTWYDDPGAVMLFDSMLGTTLTVPATSCVVTLHDNAVATVATGAASTLGPIPTGTRVLVYNQNAYANVVKYGGDPKPGNDIVFRTEKTATQTENQALWDDVVTSVSAGPMLVLAGRDASGDNPDFKEAKQAPDFVALKAFAAVLSDGRLMLGTATASNRQLAVWLIAQGATDAISLDGGASTMLYEKDAGMIVAAGRNLSNVLHIVDYASGSLPGAAGGSAGSGTTVGAGAGGSTGSSGASGSGTASAWAAADIETARGMGLLPDSLSGSWQINITRQEFCSLGMKTALVQFGQEAFTQRLLDTGMTYDEVRAQITDVVDIDVINAYRLGIISGKGGGRFDPNASLTRQEAAKILSNLAVLLGVDLGAASAPVFSDASSIAPWALAYVDEVSAAGIMKGANGMFLPAKFYTRQEAVVTVLRLFSRLDSDGEAEP